MEETKTDDQGAIIDNQPPTYKVEATEGYGSVQVKL